MRYAIYWTWNDGMKDTDIVEGATLRDHEIKDMVRRGEFKEISYCTIYASGEYGKRKYVLV